jgi:hypothetical protein
MPALGTERGPLILGAGGRVGRMWRHLAARGLWPGPEPFWQTSDGREGTLAWGGYRHEPDPRWLDSIPPDTPIIVLAGKTREDPDSAALPDRDERIMRLGQDNEAPVAWAEHFVREYGLGPILMCSSAAVYGAAPQPCHEEGPLEGTSIYGRAKIWMEEEMWWPLTAKGPLRICALRIGNVAGADALFGAMAAGPVTLDRFPDGSAPRRAYVGPLTLARAMLALLAAPGVPGIASPSTGDQAIGDTGRGWPAVNLAQPGAIAMDAILAAAGHPFSWRPAPPDALPALEMDLSRLLALVSLPTATPESLVAEARLAGWEPGA